MTANNRERSGSDLANVRRNPSPGRPQLQTSQQGESSVYSSSLQPPNTGVNTPYSPLSSSAFRQRSFTETNSQYTLYNASSMNSTYRPGQGLPPPPPLQQQQHTLVGGIPPPPPPPGPRGQPQQHGILIPPPPPSGP